MKYLDSTKASRILKTLGLKPQVIDYWVRQFWTKFSVERVFAKVTSIKPACDLAVTITLKPNFNMKSFKPGQHVSVTAKIDGRNITRTYSPTLLNDKQLQFTIKNKGQMSLYLNTQLKVGSLLELSQPFGDVTWNTIPTSDQYIFCAGGVGITPLFSLLNHSEELKNKRIELYYWAQTNKQFCFEKELKNLQLLNANFKVHFLATKENAADSRIQKAQFEKLHQSHESTTFIACGPQGFVEAAHEIANLFKANFLGETQTVFQKTSDEPQTFELNWNGQKLAISNQTTILEALEQNGFSPAHGCRMGICKTCTCLKDTGSVENLKNSQTSQQPNEEIQICVSRVQSNTTLSIRN